MRCSFGRNRGYISCPDAGVPGQSLCDRHAMHAGDTLPNRPCPTPNPTPPPRERVPSRDREGAVGVAGRGPGGEELASLIANRDAHALLAALDPTYEPPTAACPSPSGRGGQGVRAKLPAAATPPLRERAERGSEGEEEPVPQTFQIPSEPVHSLVQPAKKESRPSTTIDNRQSEIGNRRQPPPPEHWTREERLQYHIDHQQWDAFDDEIRRGEEERKGLMPARPDRRPTCKSSTSKGLTCRARVHSAGDYCFFHDPAEAARRRDVARDAGRASGESRRAHCPLLEPRVATLSDPLSIQVLLDAVVRLELLGKLTDSRGKRLARLLALAVKNVGRDGLDPAAYTARRRSLDSELSDVVRQYEQEDHVRHVESIATIGSKRQEFLKANALFAV